MTYPAYQIPDATGITWATGPFPLQALPGQYLCSKADAEIILKAFTDAGIDATLVNAVDLPSYKFAGLDAAAPLQPWWIVGPTIPPFSPAGFAVMVMWGPNSVNGGGVGNPGAWGGVGTANVKWLAAAPQAQVPPTPTVSVPGAFVGATSDATVLSLAADSHRLIVAMAKAQGIS